MTIRPLPWPLNDADGAMAPDLARHLAAAHPVVVQLPWESMEPRAAQWAAQLPDEERNRMARLHQPADRMRFLAGRIVARGVLGRHFGLAPAHVPIRIGPRGKPWAPPAPGTAPLHFNIAHAGGMVLVAFSLTHAVGVDIEVPHAAPEWASIAPRLMPPPEYLAWTHLGPAEQTGAFFRAWTRHEARLKALGLGLGEDGPVPGDCVMQWAELELPLGYAGALAWHTGGARGVMGP